MSNETFYEWCTSCNEEVELPAIMAVYKCPNCGEFILPCTLCDIEGQTNCENCDYSKCIEIWRKERE